MFGESGMIDVPDAADAVVSAAAPAERRPGALGLRAVVAPVPRAACGTLIYFSLSNYFLVVRLLNKRMDSWWSAIGTTPTTRRTAAAWR